MLYTFVSFQLVTSNIDESMMKTRLIGSSVVVQSIKLESVVARLVKVEVPESVV